MATLLLADDSVTIQRVIELTFANESIRVVTAPDGHAATAMLEADRPDIVLADVGLPAVDGYTLAERLKRNPSTARIPVLLLTGAFEPIDEPRARRSGCDGVLVKPFEPHRVVGLVKMLLAGQTPDNLWPNDMPRIDTGAQPPAAQPASARPQAVRRDSVGEPGTMPPPSAIEEVFEIGLDDLDLAFSRLDPVAAPSRIDADSVSDFQRDIEELRSVTPEPVSLSPAPPKPPPAVVEPPQPVEEMTSMDIDGLDWDLPTAPVTSIDAPMPPEPPAPPMNVVLSTPWTPPQMTPAPPPAPAPVREPVPLPPPAPVYVAPPAPPVELFAPAEAPVPPPAPPPPPPPRPAPLPPPPVAAPAPPVELFAPVFEPPPAPAPAPAFTPPTLAAAFSALLAAEQSQPASAKPAITELSTSDAMVEAVVRRVAARLTGEVDRLVREELERLKR